MMEFIDRYTPSITYYSVILFHPRVRKSCIIYKLKVPVTSARNRKRSAMLLQVFATLICHCLIFSDNVSLSSPDNEQNKPTGHHALFNPSKSVIATSIFRCHFVPVTPVLCHDATVETGAVFGPLIVKSLRL